MGKAQDEYYQRNKDLVNQKASERYQRIKNTAEFRAHHAAYMRHYYATRPEMRAKSYAQKKIYLRTTGRFLCVRAGALKRGLSWQLDENQYFATIANAVCHYCGGPLPQAGSALDRKDNSKGYSVDNIVTCCHDCNTMKGKFLTYNEMLLIWRLRKEKTESEACVGI